MTRRSKREVERALEDLEGDESGNGVEQIIIRRHAVDENGDAAGVRQEITVGWDDSGEWTVDRGRFDIPNSRAGANK